MRTFLISIASICVFVSPAQAGVFSDDLSRCFVNKLTVPDRNALMGWMFSAISTDPELQKLTTLDRSKRDEFNGAAVRVFERLLLVDCRKESVAALKAEGEVALFQAFGVLGQAASRQMFESPQAQAEMESFGKNFDEAKLKELQAKADLAPKDEKK